MKFIKSFEAKKRKKEKDNIWEFCELYLTSLLDDITFRYKVNPNTITLIKDQKYTKYDKPLYNLPNQRCNLIEIYREKIITVNHWGERRNETRPLKFKWIDMKDDIIQFLLMTEHTYGLVNSKQNIIFDNGKGIVPISIDDIDDIDDNFEFFRLFINISNK